MAWEQGLGTSLTPRPHTKNGAWEQGYLGTRLQSSSGKTSPVFCGAKQTRTGAAKPRYNCLWAHLDTSP